MPLASGSYPYGRKQKETTSSEVAPLASSEELQHQQGDNNNNNNDDFLSSSTGLEKAPPADAIAIDAAASSQSMMGSTMGGGDTASPTSGEATTTVSGAHKEIEKVKKLLPLEHRPNDQKRIRRLTSGAPLIAVASVFTSFALVLGLASKNFVWLDYSFRFMDFVKGVARTTRVQEYIGYTHMCAVATPPNVDPFIFEGCLDTPEATTWQVWLPGVIDIGNIINIISLVLGVFSNRHLRWWAAKFTAPSARIMFLVGDITGSCGPEPECCKHCGFADCGLIFTPLTTGILALISAAVYVGGCAGFYFATESRNQYRTEGMYLAFTASGLQLGCFIFCAWAQKTICHVRHVWHCDMSLHLGNAAKDKQVRALQHVPDEEPRQGLAHILIEMKSQAILTKQATLKRMESVKQYGKRKATETAATIRAAAIARLPPEPIDQDEDDEEEDHEPPSFLAPYSPLKRDGSRKKTVVGSMRASTQRPVQPGSSLLIRAYTNQSPTAIRRIPLEGSGGGSGLYSDQQMHGGGGSGSNSNNNGGGAGGTSANTNGIDYNNNNGSSGNSNDGEGGFSVDNGGRGGGRGPNSSLEDYGGSVGAFVMSDDSNSIGNYNNDANPYHNNNNNDNKNNNDDNESIVINDISTNNNNNETSIASPSSLPPLAPPSTNSKNKKKIIDDSSFN